MFNLFNSNKILLDEEIIEWIFSCYAWAFEQFDSRAFFAETILVIPDNKHFPGSQQSADGMANLIFDQVKKYAGMTHVPTLLKNQDEATDQVPNNYTFIYHPLQLKSPEGLIAHFAHGLSNLLAQTTNIKPPGGMEYLPMAGELTGIFMGFGLMFANSATVNPGGSCGSCGGLGPVRQVFLSQEEATYALALFCKLKNIEANKASKHLKKHLRGFFKAAGKDCQQRLVKYANLKQIVSANT